MSGLMLTLWLFIPNKLTLIPEIDPSPGRLLIPKGSRQTKCNERL